MTAAELASRLDARRNGSGWTARCPSHEDRTASLRISEAPDGKTLLHCHAGCTFPEICTAAGVKPAELFPSNGKPAGAGRTVAARYVYHNAQGAAAFRKVRYVPKDFRIESPDGRGGWKPGANGAAHVIYRLPETLAAVKAGKRIFVCEGEKDSDSLAARGLASTCNRDGASKDTQRPKWRTSDAEPLYGAKEIAVLPDRDEAGRAHGQAIARTLEGKVQSLRVVELPDVGGRPVKDPHDFFEAGGTVEQLAELVEAAPEWKPPAEPEPEQRESVHAESGVRGQIIGILTNDELNPVQKRTAIARRVVLSLTERGQFFFHADLRDFDSAMFFDRERKRLERVRSDSFIGWLSDWLAINRADGVFKYVQAEVETAALSSAATQPILPETYWASRPGACYLSNGDGDAVRITAKGPELVSNGTDGVLFAAGRTCAPWSLVDVPADPFETCSVFRGLAIAAPHGQALLKLWLLSLATNPKSKPPLCLAGDIGSGKTRTVKGVSELYGIPFIATKVEKEREGEFWPAIDGGGLVTFDNADTRVPWLADALANAATDGCSQRRRLYTNSETVTLRARAWIAITTANPTFASDSGLADRLLVVRLNRRTGETSDAQLTDEIAAGRDPGLTYICDALAAGLRDTKPTPPAINKRHPDFASFAVRLGRAMGREADTLTALRDAEGDKSRFCLENDPVGAALLTLARDGWAFMGTAAELKPKLAEADPELAEWSSKRVGKRLAALWPHLESVFEARKEADSHTKLTVFRFTCGVCGVSNGLLG